MTTLKHRLQARVERLLGVTFPGSQAYWERRYAAGGNSGSGSYGALATFKADVLNAFVARNAVERVVEFGCGDGHQLSLATYPFYVGIDVSREAVRKCRERFADDSTKYFDTRLSDAQKRDGFDLSLSLDVIYHLIEDGVFDRYMSDVFATTNRFVIIYSSNMTHDEFLSRYPSVNNPHVKHRRFTDWVAENRPDFHIIETIQNRYPFNPDHPSGTSFADLFVFMRQT